MAGSPTAVVELAAYYKPYAWLALTWTIPLVGMCATGMAFVAANPRSDAVGSGLGVPINRPRPLWLAIAAAAFAAFVLGYLFLIPYHEDLVGLDYASVTARRFAEIPIWPSTGRFFPLALQEYNVLRLVGRSAAVYHGFSILELFVVLICCVRILDEIPGWLRCCTLMFMMVLPSFVVAFFGIVYPERDMIVWLALWLVCLRAFDRTSRIWAFCGALVSAQCIVYYKEPAFILIGGFAASRLAIQAYRNRELFRRREYARFAAAHLLEISHLVVCAVFVAVYLIAIAPHIVHAYGATPDGLGAMGNALASYARSDWVLDVLALVVAWRITNSAVRRRPLDPLWDAVAIGALAYAIAFVKLGLIREYYQAPADFIAMLYLARLAYASLFAQPQRVALLAAIVIAWVFQRNVADAARRVLHRKQYVQANVHLVGFLRDYATSRGQRPLELYFPYVGGFELMELSAFLQLEGFDAGVGATTGTAGGPRFVMKTAHRYPGDRCLASEPFQCVYAASPQPGDLVVYLAGHELSGSTLESMRRAGPEVFHFRPRNSAVERVLGLLAPRDDLQAQNADVRVFAYGTLVAEGGD